MEPADEATDFEATAAEGASPEDLWADDEVTDDPDDPVPIAWAEAEPFTEVLDSDILLLALSDLALGVTSDFFSPFLSLTFAFSSGSYNIIVTIGKDIYKTYGTQGLMTITGHWISHRVSFF